MKTLKLQIVIIALLLAYGSANAQFGIRRAIEKQVEKQVEKSVDEAVSKELDKAEQERKKGEEEAEKGLNKLAAEIEKAQKAQEEADAKVAGIPDEIPAVGNSPYTPSESEFAFFAMKKGTVQVFATKDAKGKITGQTRNTIKEITGAKNAFAINYEGEMLDEKGKPANKDKPFIVTYRIVVKDGITYLDMKGMFGSIDGLDGVQVSGSSMKIPSNLTVGQKLDDASAKVKIGFINCAAVMTEGKCIAIENVTVEAGTFKSYKVSQKISTTVMGVKSENTNITWYVKGVGAVKTEIYDDKGKLLSTQELISSK